MKKDWKYILYLSIAFGLFIAVKLMEPKQFNWIPTYATQDKNPFGAYALRELLPSLFPGKVISVSNKTVYELKDSLAADENIIILTHSFECGKEEAKVLLDHVARGATVFISAQSFRGTLADTLHLDCFDYIFTNNLLEQRKDTAFLSFATPGIDSADRYFFKRDNIHEYFGTFDSTRTTIIAENDFNQAVTIRISWGRGQFILNSTPLAFTNIYMMTRNNHKFVAASLSFLPVAPTHWSEYYSIGRLESGSPLRYILTQEPLAWAYYVCIISILLFMVFESRRKQRVIPIIKPLENTSLEFVATIGNLYFNRGDHRNIAEKKILFFFEELREKFSVNPAAMSDGFFATLAKKTGHPEMEVIALFHYIVTMRRKSAIKSSELIELNRQIENFKKPYA